MKIGVSNFRIFKERQEFDIRPITLLTGPNNAGKSAFTKLLELLKMGVDELEMKLGRHNLGEFTNAVNWESEKKEFQIDFTSNFKFFKRDCTTKLTFNEGVVKKIQIYNLDTIFFEFEIFTSTTTDPEDISATVSWESLKMGINYREILNCFFNKEVDFSYGYSNNGKEIRKNLAELPDFSSNISFQNYRDSKNIIISKNIAKLSDAENNDDNSLSNLIKGLETFPTAFLINEIINKNINKQYKYLLYNIYINEVNVTDQLSNILLETQDKVLQESFLDIPLYLMDYNFTLLLQNVLLLPFENMADELKKNLIECNLLDESRDKFVLEENEIFKLIFQKKIVEWDWLDTNSGYTLFQQFSKQINLFEDYLNNVSFISSQRGSTDRVLLNSGILEINRVLKEYEVIHLQNNPSNSNFISKACAIFGIKGNFQIRSFENTVIVPFMELDGKEISFADLGFGYSQIFPIILKIAVLGNEKHGLKNIDKILIIEEPEANLHPNLQSKLADLFALSINTFPNLRLIIETHSEYITRKLQLLTANKTVSKEYSKIYYFNSDEFVNNIQPKVKEIEINPNGTLTEDFGPGFYDEAIRLRFDLMKLNSEQLN